MLTFEHHTSTSLVLDETPGPSRSNTLTFNLSSPVDFSSFLFEELIALKKQAHYKDTDHSKLISYTYLHHMQTASDNMQKNSHKHYFYFGSNMPPK